MNLSEPTQLVTPTLDGPVLMALAGAAGPLTGSEVHRVVRRGSRDGVRLALQRLAGQGIVDVREQGRALVYELSRQHLGADAVIALATLTLRLVDEIRRDIEAWSIRPEHVSLYGSLVRGEADERSDIDLLVVRPDNVDAMDETWNRQLGTLKVAVWMWSRNELQVLERSRAELVAERDSAVIVSVRDESVHLAGERLDRMIGPGAGNAQG